MRDVRAAVNDAGLCADCSHTRLIASDRGATFLQCQLSFADPSFAKYPRLPVFTCRGYEARPNASDEV
jgi:hypothetical protein